MTNGSDWVRAWTDLAAQTTHQHREELIELDRAIGDGDHGENLDRGFSEVKKAVDAKPDADPATLLKASAMALISKVGGASGPLLGTAYLRMAGKAKPEMDGNDAAEVLAAGLEGIVARGKASPGEKTMVDAWTPAVEAARAQALSGGDFGAVLRAAADAAAKGAAATLDLVATKGRASYLGERSAGHLDPGAVSSSYILEAAAKAVA
ncbi:MAG: dihydroxyacetone kinase subunit L [Ancrocorticia sp.]|jgi:dihydroxyacetone kinase-like protein|nr:dihydroxyacetone kinase subunit L [Ancrocorticia sp.]MCI2002817.1 dihydroxyacetone kinase subunit L [Ancrocorticia sp.]